MANDTNSVPLAGWSSSGGPLAGFTIQRLSVSGSWHYELHKHHNYCEIVYLQAGELTQTINGVESAQHAGQLVLIRETDTHSLRGSGMDYINIMFASDWLRRVEDLIQARGIADDLLLASTSPRATVSEPERPAFESLIRALLDNPSTELGRHAFARFLVNTVTNYLAPARTARFPSDLPDWLRNTVEWIDQQRRCPPPLADIVRHSSRCQEHFTREFSRHFGIPPTRYLANLRVDRAAELLVTTNATVEQVCFECGFENPSYFFRLFKRRKNMSPLTYRRAHGSRSVQVR
jgi:AraC family cel operon transcriptional repressor